MGHQFLLVFRANAKNGPSTNEAANGQMRVLIQMKVLIYYEYNPNRFVPLLLIRSTALANTLSGTPKPTLVRLQW